MATKEQFSIILGDTFKHRWQWIQKADGPTIPAIMERFLFWKYPETVSTCK